MGKIKWILGILIFLLVVYIEFIVINSYIKQKKYDRTHFPCTYIKGMCTIKPTWKNCSGGMPYNYCERILNRNP